MSHHHERTLPNCPHQVASGDSGKFGQAIKGLSEAVTFLSSNGE